METNYRNACKDLESEKVARRAQQELTNEHETQLQELKQAVVRFIAAEFTVFHR
jgi:hypothetical protein